MDSVSQFVAKVDELNTRWGAERIWFRGHERAWHELSPTLHRQSGDFRESSAFNIFWARARGLRQFDHLDAGDTWDWYFAARHHGLPSRLLDWSANALIALFFATAPRNPSSAASHNDPARVWILDPVQMNDVFLGDDSVLIPYDRDRDDFMRYWLPDRVGKRARTFRQSAKQYSNKHAVAIYPSATNARMIAQQGMFTVHGVDRRPLEVQFDSAARGRARLAYVDIEQTALASVRKQLLWLGVNQFAVDADADGLAAYLTNFYTR